MSSSSETVVRVASTPAQAKIFVAMLQAEGIPARIEGDSLVDEFAASQRLMNLTGTRVLVPVSSLDRAREILQPVTVTPEELERAALAHAPKAPTEQASAPAAGSSWTSVLVALLLFAIGAAVLFAFLWRVAASKAVAPVYGLKYEWEPDGKAMSIRRIRDNRLLRKQLDGDHDGIFEQLEAFDAKGRKIATWDRFSEDLDTYLMVVETRDDELTAVGTDDDNDGLFDTTVVTGRDGKVVQRLTWQPGKGFVLQDQ